MVVDAQVERGIVLAGVDPERRRLLAALVAAGGLARLQRGDEALGEGQMAARLVDRRGILDDARPRQHVAGDREALAAARWPHQSMQSPPVWAALRPAASITWICRVSRP